MATSPAEDVSSEDEIFFGKITMKEIRARFLPKEKRRALRHANRKKDIEMNGSDTSIKIIEMHSEPEMNIQNDWTESSYGTTSSNKADYDIKTDGENSYLRLLPDNSFLRLEKQVADCSISDDTFQNHTSEMKFCFDPTSNKQPMIANESLKQVAKTEQSHSFCNNNRDGLFQLEQDCKPIIQVQDDTPHHKQNPPTEENAYQATTDVPRQHENAKSERTPLKNKQDCEPITQVQDDTPPPKHNPPTEENANQVTPDVPRQHESAKSERTPLKNKQDCKPIIQVQDDTPHKHNPPTEENANQVTPDVPRQQESAKSETTPLKNKQDCKPIIQVQDDTPHKHNPPTEENANQAITDVPRQHERTPLKKNNFLEPPVTEIISTPRKNANNTDIFKTPKNTLTKNQQASSVTKSLRKVNTYQHVASPVALYIKCNPQAPLVHSLNTKPLPISHIPKLIKNPVKKISYKENTPLPRTVYRTPKETVVLSCDRKKISKDQHSSITTSKTVVLRKHAHNEGNLKKEIVFQEDTINESQISQPDLSVHIENSTFC